MPRLTFRRHWPLLPLLALVLLWLLWDWNWFKPLVERQASQAINRTVRIGDLAVAPSLQPLITLSSVTVENPEAFVGDTAPLATVSRVALRFGLRDLFDHRVQIATLEIDTPKASLRSDAKGLRNWEFKLPERDPDAKPWDVQIAALSIKDGSYSLVDKLLKADLGGTVQTAISKQSSEPQLLAEAKGRYDGAPLKASFTGGSILTLRNEADPYPVDFKAESGATRLALRGVVQDPLQLGGARLRLTLQGADLGALKAFSMLPIPNTPPYKVEGKLDYREGAIVFEDFKGVLGETDVAGKLSVRLISPRPLVEGSIRSQQVRLVDLSGLIGGNPNALPADAPGGDGRLLPSKPISIPRLQAANVRLDFAGARIVGEKLPFDRLSFKLNIDDGVLTVAPADLGIGEGSLRFYATLDPRGEMLALDAKAELRRVDVSRLMQRTGYQGSGRIGGFAILKGKGRSAAEIAGNGDGELKLAMAGGDFSALLLDLSGLDFGNALLSAIGIGKRTEVRCLVGDFSLEKGQLQTKSFVLDTGNTNLLLTGGASLKNETLALDLRTQPKRPNIGRLKAPIHIGGTFADPKIRPDLVDIGLRSAAAVALGTLLTPLAALLPTLQLGPGEDRDCKSLLAQAEITPPAQPKSR